MTLADQWNGIESGLDPRWGEAQLLLAIDDETRLDRAAALLAPAGPGRSGKSIRITAGRGGAGVGPEAVRRLVRRLDEEGISGTLELLSDEAGDARARDRAAGSGRRVGRRARTVARRTGATCSARSS